MATEGLVERERLSDRERQVLEHLEQARSMDVPLSEYATAYGVELKTLYNGRSQLVRKGMWPRSPAPTPARADFVPAKANGLEPHAYFSHLFAELPKATAVDHFESLLPWNAKLALQLSRWAVGGEPCHLAPPIA